MKKEFGVSHSMAYQVLRLQQNVSEVDHEIKKPRKISITSPAPHRLSRGSLARSYAALPLPLPLPLRISATGACAAGALPMLPSAALNPGEPAISIGLCTIAPDPPKLLISSAR